MPHHYNPTLFVRDPEPGLGEAVARRTFLRKTCACGAQMWGSEEVCQRCGADVRQLAGESWGDMASRVALGNSLLHPSGRADLLRMERHIASGLMLMSGRHLQHGDATQPTRPLEVFSNCASACMSWAKFYLLLNGSGVGRDYSDDLMLVDWAGAPRVQCVLSKDHPDWRDGLPVSEMVLRDGDAGRTWWTGSVCYHVVADSREGWAKALELFETMAWQRKTDCCLVLDFSKVRRARAQIVGMQGRPSAGPVPTMRAIMAVAQVAEDARRDPAAWPAWKQNLVVDHHMADCVHLGGARRAARIAVKWWRDPGILEYARLKREAGLWTANMSVGVNDEFYAALDRAHGLLAGAATKVAELVQALEDHGGITIAQAEVKIVEAELILKNASDPDAVWALRVAQAVEAGHLEDQTGEPGLVNLHKLVQDKAGLDKVVEAGLWSPRYQPGLAAQDLFRTIGSVVLRRKYIMIPNPCGESPLCVLGAYCVVADVAPAHAYRAPVSGLYGLVTRSTYLDTNCVVDQEVEDAFRLTTRAMIRVNLLPSLYGAETARTNRIGVSLTGLHEYAWLRYGVRFSDLVDDSWSQLASAFWQQLLTWKSVVQEEAARYSQELGVATPATDVVIKPAGSVSKPFLLSEGAHLPPYKYGVRKVMFQAEDPQVAEHEQAGYRVERGLRNYEAMAVVSFPTRPRLTALDPDCQTVASATAEQQFEWLRLLERHWIRGVDADGEGLARDSGGQISFTLKFDPQAYRCDRWREVFWSNVRTVRAVAVEPLQDLRRKYSYVPEQECSAEEYEALAANVARRLPEHVDLDRIECSSGACPR